MKLKVLYKADGRIVSLSRAEVRLDASETTALVLRSGVEPGEGERAALIEIDSAWDARQLRDIHEGFTVVDDGHTPRLKEHGRHVDEMLN